MVELASDSTNVMQHYAVFRTQNRKTMTKRKLQHKEQMWKLVHVEKIKLRRNELHQNIAKAK